MKKLLMLVELEYDADMMHSGDNDSDAKDWFFNRVLRKDRLWLHSDEIGDCVGDIRVLSIPGDMK